MDTKQLPEFRPGDALKADDLMSLRAAIQRQRLTTGQSSGIDLQESFTGTKIRLRTPANRYVGLVDSGGITARVGGIAGTGVVGLQLLSIDTNTLNASMTLVQVFNFSAAPPGGINGGLYCWVEQDVDGNYWIISVEC